MFWAGERCSAGVEALEKLIPSGKDPVVEDWVGADQIRRFQLILVQHFEPAIWRGDDVDEEIVPD